MTPEEAIRPFGDAVEHALTPIIVCAILNAGKLPGDTFVTLKKSGEFLERYSVGIRETLCATVEDFVLCNEREILTGEYTP